MEHRPLPHHSPAIDSFLHEIDLNWYHRAVIATELDQLDRKKFYVDSHKAQLRDARHNVSRREPSEANQYPFLCAFHFTGCDQEFANKRDWKNHVVSQHLKLDRVFWECTEGDCAHSKHLLDQCEFPQVNYLSDQNGFQLSLNSCERFANKHDFRIHLLVHHQSTQSYKNESDIISLPNADVQWLVDRSDSAMRMVCGLPQELGCPMPQCASVRFTGPAAWDQRLNHAAEHFLANPQCLDVFGGENDAELVQWASSDKVGIYQKTPNACLQKHDCNKSVADSGYSSMPSMHRQPNMSQHGDASFVVPRKIPEWTNDAMVRYQPLEEDMYSGATTRGIGDWVQDHQYSTPLMEEKTISSVFQFKGIFSQDESTGNHHTLDASQDLDSGDESDGTPDGGSESAAVEQWFHGWLRQWLAPLTQERPNAIGGRQNTTSQSQNSTSTYSSSSSTQRKRGASQPHRLPKRKRANDDDDEGNKERPKPQRTDGGPEVRMLACPYFKHNPRKYGQPKWKSCAYPGYGSMHRLKEHIQRRHALPEYQCRRCRVDLETSEALETHSQQLQACTPCIGAQDGLSQDQLKRMKSKKGTGKNKSDGDRWNDLYSIIFPYDQQTPSPYLEETGQDKNVEDFNLCNEFSRFLQRELPPRLERHLSTVRHPLPETRKDDFEQYVKGLLPQLKASFLTEMGFVTTEGSGQLDVASTTYDGESFVESTTTRRTSEDSATTVQQDSVSGYLTTTLPKGSTSQESMSMFPTSHGSQELTTMPQFGYDTANSTMFQDGNISGQDMMFPASQMMSPYFSATNQDWQTFFQFGYDQNLS